MSTPLINTHTISAPEDKQVIFVNNKAVDINANGSVNFFDILAAYTSVDEVHKMYKSVLINRNGTAHIEEADGNWQRSWIENSGYKRPTIMQTCRGFKLSRNKVISMLERIYPELYAANFFYPGAFDVDTYQEFSIYTTPMRQETLAISRDTDGVFRIER